MTLKKLEKVSGGTRCSQVSAEAPSPPEVAAVGTLSDSLYYGNACVHCGALWSHDRGSNGIPGGHPSAMFLHDLSIRPIDSSTLQAAQTDMKARSTFHAVIDRGEHGR